MKKFFKKHRAFFLITGAFFFVFVCHILYLPNSFTWLDHGDIEEGRAILPLTHLSDAFFMRFGDTGFYRPLVTIFHSFDYALYSFFAPGYHLTNIFLHSIVALIAPFFLMCFMTLSLPEILLVIFVVGFHPMSSLPAGAISYRPELLLAFFSFLTVILHVKSRKSGKQVISFFSLVIFYLALLSKETAVVIVPAMILFWEFIHRKKYPLARLSLLFSEGLVLGIYVLFRLRAVPEYWRVSQQQLSLLDAIGTRLLVFFHLIIDFLRPTHTPISDAVHITNLLSLPALIILLGLCICIFMLSKVRLQTVWSKLIFLFLLLCLPAFNIIPVPRLGSPHYGYLPLAVFAGLLVLVIRRAYSQSFVSKKVMTILFAVWFGILFSTSVRDGLQFHNDKTLFLPEVIRDSHFLEGYFYVGNWYLSESLLGLAEASYQKALHSDTSYVAYSEKRAILVNLSSVYLAKNDLNKADKTLTQAEYVSDEQNVAGLMHNRMLYLYKKHDYKGVFALSQDGRAFPYSRATYFILADSLHHLDRDKEAIALMQGLLPYVTGKVKQEVQDEIRSLHK